MDMRNLFAEKAKAVGVKLTPAQAAQFEVYLELLLKRNEEVNLTAVTDPEEAAVKHFADSLTLLRAVELKPGAKLCDVGTGAGFPGLPVKILRPDLEVTLLDSTNKRLVFLREVCDALRLSGVTLLHKRAEEAGRDSKLRERFDVVTARAVANLNILAEYCVPLVKMKGVFAPMKGPGLSEELEAAEKALETLGCNLRRVETFTLPDKESSARNIAVFQKTRFTPKEYPRHGGTIVKKPLFLEKKEDAQ